MSELNEKSIFWVTIVYTLSFLLILAGLSYMLWDKPAFTIAWVPIDIMQWAFIGGVVAVLYRLAYRPGSARTPVELYTWMVVKPIIGLVMGGLVYFLAVSGELFLNGQTNINNTQFLCVLAFIGGFSDRFSIDLINRFVSGSMSAPGDKARSAQEQGAVEDYCGPANGGK